MNHLLSLPINQVNHFNCSNYFIYFILDNEIENESYQVLVNQWDIGEGRLRPRRVLKAKNEPINKVKCDICGKFFRTEYVKVCIWNICNK
jgi:hypothetical protein